MENVYKKGDIYKWLKEETYKLKYSFDYYDYEYEVNGLKVYQEIYSCFVEDYFNGIEISEELKERFYLFLWNESYHLNEDYIDYINRCFESSAYSQMLIDYEL